jgi:hypothetical protein
MCCVNLDRIKRASGEHTYLFKFLVLNDLLSNLAFNYCVRYTCEDLPLIPPIR